MASPEIHFVMSAPRSGSTWLTNALNQHPEIFATEHRLFGQFCEVWKNNDGSSSPRITFDSYAKAVAGHYFHDALGMNHNEFLVRFQRGYINFLVSFAQRLSNKRVIVDKVTPYHGTTELVLKQIRQLLPDAKIIQLVRDGRDVATSGAFDWIRREDGATDRFAYFVEQRPEVPLNRFFDDQILSNWTDHWRETISAFAGHETTVQIRYERMKQDQPQELLKVFDAIGVDSNLTIARRCAEETTFEKTTGRAAGTHDPMAKARRGVTGDWKNYFTRSDGVLFDRLAGKQLIRLGYETSANWIERLPEKLELVRHQR